MPRRPDHYSRRAQKEGLAARSAYKLEEIDKRWTIFKPGHRVLDLGCAPGSWTQYAATRVGHRGQVLGYDLKPVSVGLPQHARTEVRDVYELLDDPAEANAYDVVLSDMAPATTGHRTTDTARSESLVEAALCIAAHTLRAEGCLIAKLLEGAGAQEIFKSFQNQYEKVTRLRPKATRQRSSEIFLIGLNKR